VNTYTGNTRDLGPHACRQTLCPSDACNVNLPYLGDMTVLVDGCNQTIGALRSPALRIMGDCDAQMRHMRIICPSSDIGSLILQGQRDWPHAAQWSRWYGGMNVTARQGALALEALATN